MKKILISAILSLLVFVGFSQDRTIGTYSFGADNQYMYYTGVALDAVSSTKDSLAIIFTMNKTYPTRYDIKVRVDSVHSDVAGSCRATVKLQGRKFTTDTWSDITSVSYYGTVDTSIYYSLNTTSTSTFLFDTTKLFGATSIATAIAMDTTALFHHGTTWGVYKGSKTNKERALYSATGTITNTGLYWYQYRLLIHRTAGAAKLNYLETRFIQ